MMLAAKVNSAASNSVTTTVAVFITEQSKSPHAIGSPGMIRCVRLWTGSDDSSGDRAACCSPRAATLHSSRTNVQACCR